jgi:hypothetical protein
MAQPHNPETHEPRQGRFRRERGCSPMILLGATGMGKHEGKSAGGQFVPRPTSVSVLQVAPYGAAPPGRGASQDGPRPREQTCDYDVTSAGGLPVRDPRGTRGAFLGLTWPSIVG